MSVFCIGSTNMLWTVARPQHLDRSKMGTEAACLLSHSRSAVASSGFDVAIFKWRNCACHLRIILKQVRPRQLPEYVMQKRKAGNTENNLSKTAADKPEYPTLARLQQTSQNTQSGIWCPYPRSSFGQSMHLTNFLVFTQFRLESALSYLPFTVYQTFMQSICLRLLVLNTGQYMLDLGSATSYAACYAASYT